MIINHNNNLQWLLSPGHLFSWQPSCRCSFFYFLQLNELKTTNINNNTADTTSIWPSTVTSTFQLHVMKTTLQASLSSMTTLFLKLRLATPYLPFLRQSLKESIAVSLSILIYCFPIMFPRTSRINFHYLLMILIQQLVLILLLFPPISLPETVLSTCILGYLLGVFSSKQC